MSGCRQSECAVIGAVLREPALLADDRVRGLRAGDFVEDDTRLLWSAILRLHAAGEHVDAVTVSESPEARTLAANCWTMVADCYSTANAATYADRIREAARARRERAAALELAEALRQGDTGTADRLRSEMRALETKPAANDIAAHWPEPIPLDSPPLPSLRADLLPGWLGEMVRAVSIATETPLELAAGFGLSAIAAAVQRIYSVRPEAGYFEPLNIWTLVALEPGNRKTAVLSAMVAPLLEWERDEAAALAPEIARLTSERKTGEAHAAKLRAKAAGTEDNHTRADLTRQIAELEAALPEIPTPPRLWAQDITPEHLGTVMHGNAERIALLSDEGGLFDILAGRYSNGVPNLDLCLQAHAGASVRVDRGSRPPVHMHSPALTIGISPQPDVIAGLAAKPGFRGRGLLGRILYLLPPSALGHRTLTTQPVPQAVRESYTAGLRSLLGRERAKGEEYDHPHTLHFASAAWSEWKEFARHVEREMQDGGRFEHARDWAGKLPGAAARLAGLLHCARHAAAEPIPAEIDETTMETALELASVLAAHALAAFALMGADPGLSAARRVWHWITRTRSTTFRARDCWKMLQGSFPMRADIEPAFGLLVERGYLRLIEAEARSAGRPSPTYQVRPDLLRGAP